MRIGYRKTRWARQGLLLLAAVVLSATLLAPDAQGGQEAAKPGDERLQKKITVRAVDLPLETVLEQVSRQSGVSLRMARDYEDRPITLRVKDLPLRDFMDAVTALYRDLWTRQGNAEKTAYVLEASAARRNRQRALLEAQKRLLQTELMETARDRAANGVPASKLEGLEPGERDKVSKGVQGVGAVLSQLPAETVARLLAGEPLRFPMLDTPGKLGEAFTSFADTFLKGWSPEARAESWVEFHAAPYTLERFGLKGVPLRVLGFGVGNQHGAGYASTYRLGVDPETFGKKLQQETARLRRGEEQDAEERRRIGGAALLERVVPSRKEFSAGAPITRSALLVALADALDLNLISDSHTKSPEPAPLLAGKTVEQALDAVCDLHACYWRIASPSTILVRSRYWWQDDLAEPPATAVVRWDSRLESEGVLPLEEALQMALLSQDQQNRLAVKVPEARTAFKDWLRFYASLTKGQRQAARSKNGVPFWQIPEAQRRLVLQNSSRRNNMAYERTVLEAAAMLKITEETEAKVLYGVAEKTFPRVLTFHTEPVPDMPGQAPKRLLALRERVILPFRERPATSPGRKSETGNSAVSGGGNAASPSSRP